METRTGLDVGPITAITLLSLWAEGKLDFTLMELRSLIKIVSEFLEELEEVRGKLYVKRR